MDSRILLTNNDVLCLLRDDANIWIGTSYGLNELKKEENDFHLIQYADEKLNNKTIHGILKDHEGKIWISTNQGLSSLNVKNNKIDNYTLNDGLQNDEKGIIDECIRHIYDKYFENPVPENMPLLEDLYDALLAHKNPKVERIANSLVLYVHGSQNYFNHHTNVDSGNRIMCFDIRDLGN